MAQRAFEACTGRLAKHALAKLKARADSRQSRRRSAVEAGQWGERRNLEAALGQWRVYVHDRRDLAALVPCLGGRSLLSRDPADVAAADALERQRRIKSWAQQQQGCGGYGGSGGVGSPPPPLVPPFRPSLRASEVEASLWADRRSLRVALGVLVRGAERRRKARASNITAVAFKFVLKK